MSNLFSDPAGWAMGLVGTKNKLVMICAVHVAVTSFYSFSRGFDVGPFIFGAVFPIYYLIALRAMVVERQEKQSQT